MKRMVLLILTDPDLCLEIMEAWDEAGAPGITVLASAGLKTLRETFRGRDDLPLMPSLADLVRIREVQNRTIFSVVDDEAQAQALLQATERIFARFEEAKDDVSAVAFVLPVEGNYAFTTSRAKARDRRKR